MSRTTTTIARTDIKQFDIIRVFGNVGNPYDLVVTEVTHNDENYTHVNGRVLRTGLSVGRTINRETVERRNETMLEAAYRCGRDYAPQSSRSAWIDHVDSQDAIEAYHNGQADQFENEEW